MLQAMLPEGFPFHQFKFKQYRHVKFKDTLPVSFRSELFTSYIITILKK